MVSTETKAHLGALGLAVAVVAVADVTGILSDPGPASGITGLTALGLVFGGGHLYLAVRGDGGMVPVEARRRYLTVLGILLATGGLLLAGHSRQVGPVGVDTIGTAVAVSTIVGYVIVEGVAGYQDRQEGP